MFMSTPVLFYSVFYNESFSILRPKYGQQQLAVGLVLHPAGVSGFARITV